MDSMSSVYFQPLLHNWCGMVHIKDVPCCPLERVTHVVAEAVFLSGYWNDPFLLCDQLHITFWARCSSVLERSLMVQWVVRSILHGGPIELFLVPSLFCDRALFNICWVIRFFNINSVIQNKYMIILLMFVNIIHSLCCCTLSEMIP